MGEGSEHGTVDPAIISALNRCIEACIDGEKGYGIAAADVRDAELKTELIDRARARGEYAITLQRLVEKLGAFAENQGTNKGALHRGLMDARLALGGRSDAVVLEECLRGDGAAIAVYEESMRRVEEEGASEEIRGALLSQLNALRYAFVELRKRLP